MKLIVLFISIVLLATSSLAGYNLIRSTELTEDNTTARYALCAMREELEERKSRSETFLKENPEGIPGIPPALVKAGIRDMTNTLKALAIVECPTPKEE